jgi:hypothetical protein
MEPVVWVHYLAEVPQRPLVDAAPNLWDVGDRLGRVLTSPGTYGVLPPAGLLCVPRFGVQLANGITSAAQGISELEIPDDPGKYLTAPGWSFTYRSVSDPLDVAGDNPPRW